MEEGKGENEGGGNGGRAPAMQEYGWFIFLLYLYFNIIPQLERFDKLSIITT